MRERLLSKRQRQCLEARRQHMTAKEIGRSLNISHNTVAMHWRLGRLKLRRTREPASAEQDVATVQSENLAATSSRGLWGLEWSSVLAAAALFFAAWMSLLFILSLCSLMMIERSR